MEIAAPVPPLSSHAVLLFLASVTALLATARLLGALARRAGLAALTGELAAGVLLGPSVLGGVAPGVAAAVLPGPAPQLALLDAVGQLAVLLLVGVTGAHLDLRVLRSRARAAVLVSLCGLVVPLALGVAAGLVLPDGLAGPRADRWLFAAFLGVAMCVTAIPVIAKTLSDLRLAHRTVGQLILCAGLVDDAAGWLLLSVVAAAATAGLTLSGVAVPVLLLAAFAAAAATGGRVLVRRLMERAARHPEPGPAVATAVLLVLGAGTLTHAMGMESLLGAFTAGLLIARVPAARPKLAPLRTVVLSVLAPLFLASAGLRMDLTELADPATALAAAALLAVAVLGKFAGAYLGARLGGLSRWEGLALGSGMNSRGVVEVVIAMVGLRLGVLGEAAYTAVVLVAVATSLMAPPLLRLTMARVARTEEEQLRLPEHEAWQGSGPGGSAVPGGPGTAR
ncbi:cation:proton antiporter [Streptomyces globosus]|uniref:Cation:proton antiporter n=1 Tax=Streptomyces globosus TaxID=68209 RepID=A0A344TZL0_9ACTN|nr:cation:proton antiporter [Streptomyces globosus]AXE24081.1 cation:proton antiporter [Streptomyces globosus]